jgi:hypothetical protein
VAFLDPDVAHDFIERFAPCRLFDGADALFHGAVLHSEHRTGPRLLLAREGDLRPRVYKHGSYRRHAQGHNNRHRNPDQSRNGFDHEKRSGETKRRMPF